MATTDWVDYHSPFNARGDGCSDPFSSPSGGGAGIGAYSWLDLALGSDTGGSVRSPAQVNGAYGNPSNHNLVSLENTMPLAPLLDTAGLLTRDSKVWKAAAHALYSNMTTFNSFPKKMYTTGFPTNASNEAEADLLSFLSKFEAFMGTNSSVLDYDSIWSNPQQAESTNASTLSDLLTLTYTAIISNQQYEFLGKPFTADSAATYGGRYHFLDPNLEVRWAYGASNATVLEEGVRNKTVFMDWWNNEVMKGDSQSCSEGLLLYPGTLARPNCRNVYLDESGIPAGWSVANVVVFAPDMVLPGMYATALLFTISSKKRNLLTSDDSRPSTVQLYHHKT
jgi:hypothetical protein